MINIRNGVFETNSSSTHSLILCMEDDYKNWLQGNVFLNENWGKEFKDAGNFLDKETAIKLLKNSGYDDVDFNSVSDNELIQIFTDNSIYTYENYLEENEYLEWFEHEYTTPGKEKVVAFGVFGYDG